MHLFYIVSALIVSIGVSFFAGADSQRHLSVQAQQNRAVAAEQQLQAFSRALRREVYMSPGQFSSIGQTGQMRVPDHIVERLDFGGFRNHGRYEFFLNSNGQIVAQIASAARYGANALNDQADILNERILNPATGLHIGRLDLPMLGLR